MGGLTSPSSTSELTGHGLPDTAWAWHGVAEFQQRGAELQLVVEGDRQMAVTEQVAQGAQRAVMGDERGQRGVGSSDHAGVAKVCQLRGAAGDITDERRQHTR